MIRYGKKEILSIYHGSNPLSAVYKGAILIWQAVRSCFGSGVWIEEKPWMDEEAWKDTTNN